MAIIIKTSNPQGLLMAIRKAIDDGHVTTWSYDDDGDFTHTPDQYNRKAWLRPESSAGELKFGIVYPQTVKKTKFIYGIYHGRFIEMLLVHFNSSFTLVSATSKLTKPDVFNEEDQLV